MFTVSIHSLVWLIGPLLRLLILVKVAGEQELNSCSSNQLLRYQCLFNCTAVCCFCHKQIITDPG